MLSLEALQKKLIYAADNGTLPKIIIPVHLAGTSCSMRDIESLVRPYGIHILEDASHAVGGSYQGLPIGSCLYISVFSFHPVKIITTGEIGAATTNDSHLADQMLLFRSHGITKDAKRFEHEPAGPWCYEQQTLGFNYRLTDLQAALGLSQLQRLSSIVEERNLLYMRYASLLKSLPVQLLQIPSDCHSALHLGVILLHGKTAAQHRSVFEGLREAGIGVQLHYSPVHLQPYYRRLGFDKGDFPHAEAYAYSAISLPLFPGLSRVDQDHVVATLAELLANA